MTKLLLIESPGKIKKLSQILGNGWLVKASMGHIRELALDGEDALGFDLEGSQVRCRYEPKAGRGRKVLSELRQAIKETTDVYIATDPDREGETIGWHLAQELRLKQPKRVTYTEITKAAVMSAIANPKTLDQNLIAAGRARDCLDKLVGYKGSKHLVWALNNGAKSMGRVQSATLHLLCQREKEIVAFVSEDYWSVWVEYKEGFKAFYRANPNKTKQDNSSEPDDAAAKNDTKPESDRVKTQAEADRLVAIAKANPHQIINIENKTVNQSPPAAFITSTLQQAAGAKLRKSPEQTMKIAQSLYEAGYITYMRTDSVVLSDQFCAAVRQYLQENDPENVPAFTTKHRSKQSAQEAHEAIRPTDVNRLPEQLRSQIGADEANLYELIWNRAVASQCRPAQIAKTRIITQSADIFWEARGQVLLFAGYTRYWNNISEDVQLPNVVQGQAVILKKADSEKKQTQPPPRYTEPKLVQLMERKGIGRPSTYSPTIKTLKERGYVQLTKSKVQPTQLGMELDAFLETVLPDLITSEFTAQMEKQLDTIAEGKQNWEQWLTTWNREYFEPALKKAIQAVKANPNKTNSTVPKKSNVETVDILCPKCSKQMVKVPTKSAKVKAGHFLSCDKRQDGCGAVMFMNERSGNYELPYSERSANTEPSENLTEFFCPVCNSPLEKYNYSDKKTGESKTMLRCSDAKNRQGSCKEVAFWWTSQQHWWSKVHGELGKQTSATSNTKKSYQKPFKPQRKTRKY
ncbi:type I DNA topoisomerase [Aerosakkonemataceae cyanobacterium BLCC-F50]|uniref:DNA topoisomerase 1 n=1 Tax=Floridaenema flaviceps BLCC-F50 TaxID=3153642 RepID=A0ABV4Y1B4_9CYAN